MGKKYDKLERKIENEYERKGISRAKAEYYGKATAGKVFREQEHKCEHCRNSHPSHMTPYHCHSCNTMCSK